MLVPNGCRRNASRSVGPAQPIFCSAKYIQNEGMIDVEIRRKNMIASENSTAFVQVHSKSRRKSSTRGLQATAALSLP